MQAECTMRFRTHGIHAATPRLQSRRTRETRSRSALIRPGNGSGAQGLVGRSQLLGADAIGALDQLGEHCGLPSREIGIELVHMSVLDDTQQVVGSADRTHVGYAAFVKDGSRGDARALLDAVFAVLQPLLDLVNGLADLLINPLLNLLGIHTGTATVTMESVVVGQPQLVSVAVPV